MADGHVSYSVSGGWLGDKVGKVLGAAGARGVTKAAERLKALSVPLAPKDRGPLRKSASVKPAMPFVGGGSMEAVLIFDTPYAAIQHEDESFVHDDGQSHYVSEPMTDRHAELQAIIAKEVRNGILKP